MAIPVLSLLGLILVAPGLASAQSLADLAKKEEARRQAVKGEVKTLTNKDLGRGATLPPAPATPPATMTGAAAAQPAEPQPAGAAATTPPAAAGQIAADASGKKPAEAPPAGGKGDEKFWRKRVTDVQDRMSQTQVLADALQSRINALTTDFVNRDDPAQRAQIAQDRQRALGELDRMNKEIDRLKKDLADIQEEARKAGVPPGWLR